MTVMASDTEMGLFGPEGRLQDSYEYLVPDRFMESL